MQTDVQTLTLLRADLPPTGIRLGELPPEPQWPANTPRIEPEWLKQIWGDAIDSRQVWLRNSPPAPFVAEWQPETMPPEKHHAYAVTWFTMAIVVAALAIGLQLYAWRSR